MVFVILLGWVIEIGYRVKLWGSDVYILDLNFIVVYISG